MFKQHLCKVIFCIQNAGRRILDWVQRANPHHCKRSWPHGSKLPTKASVNHDLFFSSGRTSSRIKLLGLLGLSIHKIDAKFD